MKKNRLIIAIVLSAMLVCAVFALTWLWNFKYVGQQNLVRFFPRFHTLVQWTLKNYYPLKALLLLGILLVWLLFGWLHWQLSRFVLRYNTQLLLSLFTTLATLLAAEVVLRTVFHLRPGNYRTDTYLTEVAQLKLLRGLSADSLGILKADPAVAKEMARYLERHPTGADADSFTVNDTMDVSVFGGVWWSQDLISGHTQNAFNNLFHQIAATPVQQRTDLQQGIYDFVFAPYNFDGFRSIPFRNYKSCKKKVLLLGDSFTWGGVASVLSNSFADLLLTKGYAVYNTGITGADPEQYLAVAKEYIDTLKPDVVVVNVFTGNDINYFKRPVLPYVPIYYSTNAGNIFACPQGIYYRNMYQAYEEALQNIKIPVNNNFFNALCAKTCVTSLIWGLLERFGWVNPFSYQHQELMQLENTKHLPVPVCQQLISEIKQLCLKNDAKFVYIQIPDLKDNGRLDLPKDHIGFADTIPCFVAPVTASDYSAPEGHFNDAGHSKYADFIDKIIDSLYRQK